jgi:prevent-host-death family protein
MTHMARVTVRELQQHASAVLRRVEGGERIDVTSRGRVVARLVPLRAEGRLAQLIAEGKARPGEGSLAELPEPIAPRPGATLPSEALKELRDGER